MKKLMYLIVAIVILGLITSGCFLSVVPPTEKDEITSLTKAKPGTDFNGPHYNLNIIGKKSDWSGGGSYDNPNRHTMFVPEDIDDYYATTGIQCFVPSDPPNTEPGITISITQCPKEDNDCDFAVVDGNAFGDCYCEFRLAKGEYDVYIVAKAKPPKPGEDYYTNIDGWITYTDETNGTTEYFKNIGSVTVRGKKWIYASDIIYVSCDEDDLGIVDSYIGCNNNDLGMWVFDYLAALEGDPYYMTDTAYFWQYDNHGNKLVKVRFYKVK